MDIRFRDFLNIIESNFKAHLGEKIFFELEDKNILLRIAEENIYISKLSVFGTVNLEINLITSRATLKNIIEKSFGVDFSEVVKDNLEADSFNEFLNLIIANSTEALAVANLPVEMKPPKSSSSLELTENINANDIFVSVNTDENEFYCIMIIKNMELR